MYWCALGYDSVYPSCFLFDDLEAANAVDLGHTQYILISHRPTFFRNMIILTLLNADDLLIQI